MGRTKGSKNKSAERCTMTQEKVAMEDVKSCCEVVPNSFKTSDQVESFTKALNLINDLVTKFSKLEDLIIGHNNLGQAFIKAAEHAQELEKRLIMVESFIIKSVVAQPTVVAKNPLVAPVASVKNEQANNGTIVQDVLDGI